MGRTARRVLESGSIAFLLALTVVAGGAARAAADALMEPSPALLASPSSSAEPTAAPAAGDEGGIRGALELILLALTCAAVMAFYSITTGERGGTRVPARVRRR